jgi:hypothetical protein
MLFMYVVKTKKKEITSRYDGRHLCLHFLEQLMFAPSSAVGPDNVMAMIRSFFDLIISFIQVLFVAATA